MTEKACVVVEGMTDATIVRAILPPDLLEEVMLAPAGGRSNITSAARTIVVTRRKPVAILVDTDSVEAGGIQERLESTQELLNAVAGAIPTRVIPLIPTIESVFFVAGVLTKVYGAPLPEDVRILARSNPRGALERLLAEPNKPNNIKALLDSFGAEEIAAIRATPPFQELISFVMARESPGRDELLRNRAVARAKAYVPGPLFRRARAAALILLTTAFFIGGAATLKRIDGQFDRLAVELRTAKETNGSLIRNIDRAVNKLADLEQALAAGRLNSGSMEYPLARLAAEDFYRLDPPYSRDPVFRNSRELAKFFTTIEPDAALRALLSGELPQELPKNPDRRLWLGHVLGGLVTSKNAPILLSIAADGNLPLNTRENAVNKLAGLPDPDAVPALAKIADDELAKADLRIMSAKLLAEKGPRARDAMPVLTRMLESKDPSLAAAGADALKKIDLSVPGPAALVVGPQVASAQPAANRKVFTDSVTELPPQPARFAQGLMVQAAAPAYYKAETLDLLFSLEIPKEAQKELEDAVAKGKVISREKLKTDYSPKQEDVDALTKHLKDQGFEVTKVTPNRTSVYARATAAQIEKTLQVQMVRVFRGGVTYTAARNAPSLPTEASSGVLAITGLQPFRHANKSDIKVPLSQGNRASHRVPGTGPLAAQPGSAPNIANAPPYLVSEILKAYNADSLGVNGAGEKIAILIDTFPLDSDLQAFWAQNGLSVNLNQIEEINVKGVTLPGQDGEETLNVEWASGIAPGATVRVYASSSLAFVDLNQALDAIIADLPTQPAIHQLSVSLGLGETYMGGPHGEVATLHQKFLQLAAAGVNVFVSSGNAGSHPDSAGQNPTGPLQVEYKASDSVVIGVGGTSLTLSNAGGVASEVAWTGSGGGISIFFGQPSWQTGNGVPAGNNRLVPDVSLMADPSTGALVILNGRVVQSGGTSWGTPTWAGFCALINSARAQAGKPPLGFLNPQIYPLIGQSSFRDITSGCNGPNNQYNAGPGYDLVTGIGVPNVQQLNAALP